MAVKLGIDEIEFLTRQFCENVDYFKKSNIDFICFKYPLAEDVMNDKEIERFKPKEALSNAREDLMSEDDKRKFYGDLYRIGLAEDMVRTRSLTSSYRNNGILKQSDFESELINIKDGHRVVPNAPKDAARYVYLVGKCNFFSAYQSDDHTLGFYLQEKLNKEYPSEYKVIIASNLGVNEFSALFCEKYRSGDVVCCSLGNAFLNSIDSKELFKIVDLKNVFSEMPDLSNHLFNNLWHHDHILNEKIADVIFQSVKECHFSSYVVEAERRAKQNYYIPIEADICYRRLKQYADSVTATKPDSRIGSIVMNCNPFTYGHRYIIEEALKQVDFLYIFVVKENKSRFLFEDRLRMVQRGVEDLGDKVCVLSSGEFVISKETFAQYFDKDYQVIYVDDMSYDLRIFGEVVSKYFNISIRFVGEEPFDRVTAKYNETMKRILPGYGVSVVEIPRVKADDNEVVSATRVRNTLDDSIEILKKLVPENEILDLYSCVCAGSEMGSESAKLFDKDALVEIVKRKNNEFADTERVLRTFCEEDNSEVYIYGAGRWGKGLFDYLKQNDIVVFGFVVDDEYVAETCREVSVDVLGMSELEGGKHKVIIATSRREVFDSLLSWGGSFIRLPEWFMRKITVRNH